MWDISGKKLLILGANGLVGSAVLRRLEREDCTPIAATRQDADLTNAAQTAALIKRAAPDAIILAAAKVGGILANRDNPVEFLTANQLIQLHVLKAAHDLEVERLILLGSSCIYPKFATQPISEHSLMTGALEPTNDAYAIAKIAGIRLVDAYRQQFARNWISAMPTNLYGPQDNFDPISSHVLPALLRKFHDAKTSNHPTVEIWGTGTSRREFMHVDDCADALIYLLKTYNAAGPINIGAGEDITINEAAEMIKNITGYEGEIVHDLSKPDGTPAKLMDNSRLLKSGWSPKIDLRTGLAHTYAWYLNSTLETQT